MIELLYFTKGYRCFKAGDIFTFFEGTNLLVGDQGCGKSTILQCIAALGGCEKPFWKKEDAVIKKSALLVVEKPARVFAHDFENDSPRTSPSFDTMGSLPFELSFAQMRMSHGQASNTLVPFIAEMKDAFLLLDEPDVGMSGRSALALAAALKKAASNNCQIIAAVHNPWLIEQFDKVYDIERNTLVSSGAFLAEMRKPKVP